MRYMVSMVSCALEAPTTEMKPNRILGKCKKHVLRDGHVAGASQYQQNGCQNHLIKEGRQRLKKGTGDLN